MLHNICTQQTHIFKNTIHQRVRTNPKYFYTEGNCKALKDKKEKKKKMDSNHSIFWNISNLSWHIFLLSKNSHKWTKRGKKLPNSQHKFWGEGRTLSVPKPQENMFKQKNGTKRNTLMKTIKMGINICIKKIVWSLKYLTLAIKE